MDLHCSLRDGHSFTDPVTNWTLISGVKITNDLAGMLQAGKYPQEYFPAFLHEFVHHWCFHTPVGLSLALLQMRARRRALLLQVKESEPGTDALSVAEDIVRYESAISVMRPLAEGLALFAEFDTVPGESPVISMPMRMVEVFFTTSFESDVKDGVAPSTRQIKHLLMRHRISDAFIDRKAGLLVHPFTSVGGGYLIGYLTVKNYWNTLVNRSKKLRDADLFLSYLKAFIYDDDAFVATLLDPDTMIMRGGAGDGDCADSFFLYFQRRFSELLRVTTDATVAEFERCILEPSDDRSLSFHFWGDQQAAMRGRDLKTQLVAELLFEGAPKTLSEKLRRSDQWAISQRGMMCVGSFSAPVEVDKQGRVSVGISEDNPGFPLFNLQGLEKIEMQNGDGSLEYFISPSGLFSFMAVTLNDKVIAIGSLSSNVTPELKEQLARFRTSLTSGVDERTSWRAVVDHVLDGDRTASDYRKHFRDNTDEAAGRFFVDKALAHTEESLVEQCANVMQRNGFYEFLGSDYDAVKDVALLSLASATNNNREFIAKVFEVNGRALDAILAKINACESRYGLKLVLAYQVQASKESFIDCFV